MNNPSAWMENTWAGLLSRYLIWVSRKGNEDRSSEALSCLEGRPPMKRIAPRELLFVAGSAGDYETAEEHSPEISLATCSRASIQLSP